MSEELIRITNTSLSYMRTCPKKYYLRYVLGYVPAIESEALNDGRLWHELMERTGVDEPANIIQFIETQTMVKAGPNEARCARFMGMYMAYLKRGPICPQRREVGFETTVINPATGRPARGVIMAGKIDGILTEGDDNWIVEHKTTSAIRPGLFQIELNYQVHLYALNADVPITGIIYDVIQKPSIRLKQKQTAAEYRKEVEAWYEIDSEKKFYRTRMRIQDVDIRHQLWMQHKLHLFYRANNYWPRTTESCFSYYGTCAYYNYCSQNDNEMVLNTDFRKLDNVHPELKAKEPINNVA